MGRGNSREGGGGIVRQLNLRLEEGGAVARALLDLRLQLAPDGCLAPKSEE